MTAATPAPTGPVFTGVRQGALTALGPLCMLFLLLGVLQIFFAGFGVYDLHGAELGAKGETAFDPHRINAMVMSVVALLILIAAAVARPGARPIWMAAGLLLIVLVLQGVLASLGEDTAFFGGLHAVLGIGSLGLASSILADARRARTT